MNSANKNDRLVAEYLERLTRARQDLPCDRRDSIIEDIREHIRTARAGMASEDEAQIRQLLEDLGSPQAIRAEAGLPPHSRAGRGDILAPWLLLLGGFVFVVGWLVGVVLLWNSSIWSTRDKLLATVIWPGGLAGVLYGLSWRSRVPRHHRASVAQGSPPTVHLRPVRALSM